MPKPTRNPQSYRESQQKGSTVNITVSVPRPIAKMVHLHARIKNQTVSALLREQLEGNYKHLSRFSR
jgi:hypothetical protein